MKKVIETLEQIKEFPAGLSRGTVTAMIDDIIAELQTPRWYTPEQWKERTGEPWPDNGAVYALEKGTTFLGDFIEKFTAMDYGEAKWKDLDIIVVATEAGPPNDGWRPEKCRGNG